MAMNVDMTSANALGNIRSTDRPPQGEMAGMLSGARDILSKLDVRLDTMAGVLTNQKNSDPGLNQNTSQSKFTEARTGERLSARLDGGSLEQIGQKLQEGSLGALANGAVRNKLDSLKQGKMGPAQTGQQGGNAGAALQGKMGFSGAAQTGSAGEVAQLEQEGGKQNASERKSRSNPSNAPAGYSATAGAQSKSAASQSQSTNTQQSNLGYQSGVQQNTKQRAMSGQSQMTRSAIRAPVNFGSKPSQQSEAVQLEMEGVKQQRFNEMKLQTDRKNKSLNLALSKAADDRQREGVQAQLEGAKMARMNELKARKKKGQLGGVDGKSAGPQMEYGRSGSAPTGFSEPSPQPRQINLNYTPYDPTFVSDALEQTSVLRGASRQAMSLVNGGGGGYASVGAPQTPQPTTTEPQQIVDVLGLIELLLNEYCNSITARAEELGDSIKEMSEAVGEINQIWGEIMVIAIAATNPNDPKVTFNMESHQEIGPLLDELSIHSDILTGEDYKDVLQFADPTVDYMQVQQYNANVTAYCDTVQVEIDSLTNDFEQLMSQISSIEEEIRNLHQFNTAFARR